MMPSPLTSERRCRARRTGALRAAVRPRRRGPSLELGLSAFYQGQAPATSGGGRAAPRSRTSRGAPSRRARDRRAARACADDDDEVLGPAAHDAGELFRGDLGQRRERRPLRLGALHATATARDISPWHYVLPCPRRAPHPNDDRTGPESTSLWYHCGDFLPGCPLISAIAGGAHRDQKKSAPESIFPALVRRPIEADETVHGESEELS